METVFCEPDDRGGVGERLVVVGDDQYTAMLDGRAVHECLHDTSCVVAVELVRRFVGEHDRSSRRERSRDREALQFAT
jgi:hypothetical protein